MIIKKENCRLCQKDTGIIPLEGVITKILFNISQIEVEANDDLNRLPTSICLQCNHKILDIHLFITEIQNINKCLIKTYLDTSIKDMNSGNTKLENNSPNITLKYFVCPICSKSYRRISSFETHSKIHPELNCTDCGTYFASTNECKNHVCEPSNSKKKAKPNKLVTNKIKGELESQRKEKNDLRCTICNLTFEDKDSHTIHLGIHSKYTCSEENCFKEYKTAYSLKIHKLNHEGKRSFLCVSCGKSFISKKSLLCHEKIHAAIKAHKCEGCNVSFSARSNFRAHIKRYHEGVRYHCSKCPREFLSKNNLERHEKIHIGIKEFKCQQCISAFYTKKELLKHQKYHQGLRQHKCEQCFKAFFERHHLIIHMRSHSGERPYVCKLPGCGGKSFYDSQKLKRHQKSLHCTK